MSEIITLDQLEGFKAYMRQMLDDIAGAKVSGYINNNTMQEVAMIWNEGDEPAIKDYPHPENLTHISTKPYPNPVEAGEYAFKRVVNEVMTRAGLIETDGMFISEMDQGQFSCNMHSGCDADHDYASVVYMFFIRANDALQPALDYMAELSDDELDEMCRAALQSIHYEVEDKPFTRLAPTGRGPIPKP